MVMSFVVPKAIDLSGNWFIASIARMTRSAVRPGTMGHFFRQSLLTDMRDMDGMVEVWDAAGGGWGRSGTDAEGRFRFVVAKPDAPQGRAPWLDVFVFARGLLRHPRTRIYFPDEPGAHAADPALSALDERERQSLVARQQGAVLLFDIRMQGESATVFFAQ